MLVYALVILVVPRARPRTAVLLAVALSWAVEFLQLTGVPHALGRRSFVFRLVLGSTFNAPDLLWYVVGGLVAGVVHGVCAGWRSRAPVPSSVPVPVPVSVSAESVGRSPARVRRRGTPPM
ncbi:ribosomal maturation YjgA family protein [Streptomyces tsukubensis]|uniref:DUF2809 domain-containing protein n=1 Tax=Streptomyces tsukubensis TaxID=83656 RepID=A0A1V4A986_9ACTN|nr:DUF2809 domain-containing protein [Streptomyces tsukubensis]OON79162.1 hypothetical protein B1H18_14375 [Streptomyces tsukubensis]QFR94727.1 DUF2809 domain-containing protein [Streptomyces tsukubensis]